MVSSGTGTFYPARICGSCFQPGRMPRLYGSQDGRRYLQRPGVREYSRANPRATRRYGKFIIRVTRVRAIVLWPLSRKYSVEQNQ